MTYAKFTTVVDNKNSPKSTNCWQHPNYIKNVGNMFLLGLFQNWCSLSPDGLVTTSMRILIESVYSVVHYLSNKHPQTPVCQIDLELQLVFWKLLRVKIKINENTNQFLRLYIWHFLSWNTVSLQLHTLPFFQPIFFNDGFKPLHWNAYKDHLGFLDHLDICFKVPVMQFMFQQWKQPEII